LQVLTEKNFNKTCFADGAKSVVFFNDVEEDGEECVMLVRIFGSF